MMRVLNPLLSRVRDAQANIPNSGIGIYSKEFDMYR
jgi:hypothetical protein